jgi:serine/threonine protein kinase
MPEDTARHPNANPSALPVGTRLGEFELRGLLGIGGFGIVYLAFDHALEREVAVKEYMPASLAGRTETMFVSIRSQSDADTFALGLKSFVNEARLLARFDHPSLLKVHRFWEGNGTAYMAMPVLQGRTLKEVRLAMSQPPGETWLRELLVPLLGAIERLHSEGVYHRDIAPDNIQIEPDGRPVLLDFGAARRVLSDKSQALTAILKPAYAPIEQYAEVGSVKQGPWTDIYALGATLHFVLLGRPPAPATARAVHDEASALTTLSLPDCSENFLRIVDWMLAPRPADRPQSVAALRDVLDGRTATPLRRAAPQQSASDWDRTVILPPSQAPALGQQTVPVMPRDVEQTVRVAQTAAPPQPQPQRAGETAAAPTATAGRAGSRRLAIGFGLGALVLLAVAALALRGKPAVQPAVAEPAAASAPLSQAAPASAAAPVAESAVTTVVVAGPASAAVPAAGSSSGLPARSTTVSKPARSTAAVVLAPSTAVPLPAAQAPEPVKPQVEPAPAPVPTPAPAPAAEVAPQRPAGVTGPIFPPGPSGKA